MMNQKLACLYEEYFVNNQPIVDEELLELSIPLLLKVNESYENAKLKVMIVGKETFTFYEKYEAFLSHPSPVEYAQEIYTNFVKEESKKYNSPFWDYINQLFTNADVAWIWNNVFKLETVEYLNDKKYLGKKVSLGELPSKYRYMIDKIKLLQKDVFLKELEILKPDIVIFFTGHPYDRLFMDWQFDTKNDFYQDIPEEWAIGINKCEIDKWKFGRFSSPLLPYKTFRTYHPNYFRRVSKKRITPEQKESIFNILKAQITQ